MAQGTSTFPNYFLAIQITDEEIKRNVRAVQEAVVAIDGTLSSRMEAIETLHLTLGLYYLKDGQSVSRDNKSMLRSLPKTQVYGSLGRFHRRLREENFVPPHLTVSGLGHFYNKVLYAALEENQGLEDLKNDVRGSLSRDGIRTTEDKFTPHVTICKIPRNSSSIIDPSCYEGRQSTYFGRQTVESIQLCSMQKPKTESGYYHVDHEIRFQ